MDEKINAVINNLCEKFGTTTQFLVPEIAKYEIATDVVGIIFSTVLIIILVIIAVRSHRVMEYDDGYEVPFFVSIFFALIFVAILWVCVSDAVGWMVSPYGAVVQMITRRLN